jgi:hypothetical protein
MDLTLAFAAGRITGDGVDDIGRFLVRGRYDLKTRGCYWTKTYVGKHDVFYRGFSEHKGIWGVWDVGDGITGGFKIWPLGTSGDDDAEIEKQEEEIPDAAGVLLDIGDSAMKPKT